MADAKDWYFYQKGGEKKLLVLTGWAAPHGRPRQKAVVTDGIEIRKEDVYYPGDEEGPTRHLFGRKYIPWELEGRFRDRSDGAGFAKSKTEEVKRFVADQQAVSIYWGDIAAVDGFIRNFEPGRESEGEVAWRLVVDVDKDLLAKKKRPKVKPPITPAAAAKLTQQDLATMLDNLPHTPSTDLFEGIAAIAALPGNVAAPFFEAIDNQISKLTGLAGSFQKAAQSISNIEKMTFAEANKLATVSTQLQGGIGALDEISTNIRVDAALLREKAVEAAKLWKNQSAVAAALRDIMATLAETRVAARFAALKSSKRTYAAKQGDTWESIATQFYGTPSRAIDIIVANNIPAGQKPVPGAEYVLPA